MSEASGDVERIVGIERLRQGQALEIDFDDLRLRDDSAANRNQLSLFYASFFSGSLGIGTHRFQVSLSFVPPFNEVAAFGVQFFLSADAHAVATDTALAIEQDTGVPPFVVNLDLLKKGDAGSFRHFGECLPKPLIESPINCINASK